MIRRPPRSTQSRSSAASDVYKRQPQDRGKMGASLVASILEDAIMTHHILDPRFGTWRGLGLDYRHAAEFVDQIRDQFTVSMGHSSDPFRSLSGGNQQKVILGRELLLETPFVLMDQPPRCLLYTS